MASQASLSVGVEHVPVVGVSQWLEEGESYEGKGFRRSSPLSRKGLTSDAYRPAKLRITSIWGHSRTSATSSQRAPGD